MINNYIFGKFEADTLHGQELQGIIEFIQDLQTTSQQVGQNVSFGDIGLVVGPSSPGNPWAITNRPRNILRKPQQQAGETSSDLNLISSVVYSISFEAGFPKLQSSYAFDYTISNTESSP